MTGEESARSARAPKPAGRRMSAVLALGLIAVLLSLLSVSMMGSAATDCRSSVRGAPGDGTTGAVWLNWAWNETGGTPFESTQHVTGGDRGDALWQPVMVVNSGWSLPMWALEKVVGPVCGYNAIIMVGQVTSGLGMWLLAMYLTGNVLASGVASVAYGFSAFVQMKSEGHVSGAHLGAFPLLVLCLLLLWEKPSWRRAALTAVPWAYLAYVDGYYLAFSIVLVGAFTLGSAVADLSSDLRGSARSVLRRIAHVAIAGSFTLVLLIPFAAATLSNRATINSERTRTLDSARTYSARPVEYLLPSYSNPVFGRLVRGWRNANLHGSNYVESTIYLGWTMMILAGAGVFIWTRRVRTARVSVPEPPTSDERPGATDCATAGSSGLRQTRSALGAVIAICVLGFLASLPPEVRFGGISVPLPSRFLHGVFPQLRVFSRLFVVVSCGIIALASIGMAAWFERIRSAPRRIALAGVLVLLVLLESLTFTPFHPPVWSYSQSPTVYRALGEDPAVTEVARYPMDSPLEDSGKLFLTFQPVMDKPLVNPVTDTTRIDDPSDIARGLAALSDPQTIPALRALGADTVMVETQTLGTITGDEAARLGLVRAGSYRYDIDDVANQKNGGAARWSYLSRFYDVDVYRIGAGPVARSMVALGSGWSPFASEGFGGSRWMSGEGILSVVELAPIGGSTEIGFRATAFGPSRTVRVYDQDTLVTEFTAPGSGVDVRFRAPTGRALRLVADPGPIPIKELTPDSSDPRSLTILISQLWASP